MLKNFLVIGSLASVLSFSSIAYSQAAPTAQARTAFQIGTGYTNADADYGQKRIQGISFYGDYDVNPLHVGLTGEAHFVNLVTPDDLGENSYLVGARLFQRFRILKFYGKGLIGDGNLRSTNPLDIRAGNGNGNFFVAAAGAGVDILATKHFSIRPIDFEYQRWSYRNGLAPKLLTFGVAYRFH